MSKIVRYSGSDRFNHWLVALLFVLAAVSGLAFFHPSLFFLSNVLGGGQLSRILHPFIGVAMFVLFVILYFKFWHHNILHKNDRQWLKQIGDVIADREERLPEVGRYNGGQKLLFWVMTITMLLLVISGMAFWRPYFASNFHIDTVRLAAVVHAGAAAVLILGIIVHVYAALWVKGTIRGMWTGVVTSAWARKHHPGWYKEVSGGK
ncbi:MAG: formate dehydrogenase subunit gamma [Burkholderiaceae bacterium]|jgi:formate dehydrogenase subunit gamma|nr:formate dehydrogenase subunit gamma [Burkholderiaceae bacterium]